MVHDVHSTSDDIEINTMSTIYIPVRVISGDGLIGYTCNIYENGLNNAPTKQGKVYLANGASTIYPLPAGTVMYAQLTEVQRLGSN